MSNPNNAELLLTFLIILIIGCDGERVKENKNSSSKDSPQKTEIDQQTRRRIMKTGVTAYDPDYASPGYVLYCPSFLDIKVNLIDLRGKIIHQWEMPSKPGLWGYLLPNGNLFYTGKSEVNHASGSLFSELEPLKITTETTTE